ncbi:hybrid sensor histidine kinase/response regulator transcription factor [Aliikangiella sp. IMCC44359]|uniref:hybrid sensor histidine kinase/response regulator transcription factor n=1 Tax=Aliikangiella sp. IMCC44359 TaxID=3459125 RepID=UPI00403B2B28
MKYLVGKLIWIFFFSSYVANTFADSSWTNLSFKKWANQTGLAQNTINVINQDNDGYIWVGTDSGVSRFDGYEFKRYIHESDNDGALLDNQVRNIFRDKLGRLWFISEKGLSLYQNRHDSFKNFTFSDKPSENYITAMNSTNGDQLWIATLSGHVFTSATESISFKPVKVNFPKTEEPIIIRSFLEKDKDTFWLATTQGLWLFNKKTSKAINVIELNAKISKNIAYKTILKIDYNREGDLIVQTNYRIYRLKNHNYNWKLILKHNDSRVEQVNRSRFKEFAWIKNQIAIPTNGNGLIIMDEKAQQLNQFITHSNSPNSIADNYLMSIFIDDDDGVWLGSQKGLIYTNNHQRKFGLINHTNFNNCLPYKEIYSLAKLEESILVGLKDGGAYQINTTTGQCDKFLFEALESGDYSVSSITVGSHGEIWLGTISHGLFYSAKGNEQFLQVLTNLNQPVGQESYVGETLIFDEQVWSATYKGLLVYDPKLKKAQSLLPNLKNPFALENRVNTIQLKSKSELWLGTQAGVYIYNFTNKAFSKVNLQNKQYNDLSITSLTYPKANRLFIGTYNNGLIEFDGEKIIQTYSTKNGLIDDTIAKIISDDNENLWVASNRGLSKVDINDRTVSNFDSYLGVQSGAFLPVGIYDAKNRNILLGGEYGINYFSPDDIVFSKRNRAVQITNYLIDNKPINLTKEVKHTNKQRIDLVNELIVYPEHNIFSLTFSALDYKTPKNIRYRYRLIGFDDKWIETDATLRNASFSRLAAGDYVFQVNASELDNQWSDKVSHLNIKVLPPVWLTWWAKTIYIVTFLALLFIFYRYRTYSIRKRADDLAAQVELQTLEINKEKQVIKSLLEYKNREFANVSHEFRTPLTLVLGPVKNLLKLDVSGEIKDKLKIVKRNGYRLLRMVDQLIYMEKYRVEKTGNKQAVHLTTLIYHLTNAFSDLGKERGITFELQSNDDVWINSVPDAIDKILLNLLSNAVKYTQNGGHVWVACKKVSQHECLIQVKDTGVGIPEDMLQKVFDRYQRVLNEQSEKVTGAGIGLSLVKELVESHDGRIELESELGKGSCFSIYLPVTSIPQIDNSNKMMSDNSLSLEIEGLTEQSNELSETDKALNIENSDSKAMVLIVEDNLDMQKYIIETLQPIYHCIAAESGDKGIYMATEFIPDLIISDIMMPGKDGFELSEILKQDDRTCHIPIVLLTARSDRQSRLTGWKSNVDEYLTKPFDEEELMIRVSNLLSVRKILCQRFSRNILESDTMDSSSVSDEMSSVDAKFLIRLESIVTDNFSNNQFGIKELSGEIGIGERQFQRKLKSLIDISPSEYLRSFRLAKAHSLLISGETIKKAAFNTGFSSTNYFSSCFKAQYGKTPKQVQSYNS